MQRKHGKILMQIYWKIYFPIGHFRLPLLTLRLEVKSLSIHHLISIWSSLAEKWLTIFEKVLSPFWKMFLWYKQLFDYYILIKRLLSSIGPKIMAVRHLKPVSNMADPISLNKTHRSLNSTISCYYVFIVNNRPRKEWINITSWITLHNVHDDEYEICKNYD